MRLAPRRSAPAFAIGLLLCVVAAAPAQTSETPEQVATRYLHAMATQQWDSMAALMHPAALRQLRLLLAPLFEAPSLDEARQTLLGVQSLKEAQALSDTACFAALISRTLSAQAQLMDILRNSRIQIIGHVPESPDTVHIVYRMNFENGEAAVSKMDVFSMQRMGNTWRGLLSGDFRMLAAMLRRQAGT